MCVCVCVSHQSMCRQLHLMRGGISGSRISWDQCFLPHPCCFEHDSFLHVFMISEGTVILLCASCDLKYMSTQKWNIYFLNKGDNSLKLDICLILPGGGLCSPGTTRWCLSVGVLPWLGSVPLASSPLGFVHLALHSLLWITFNKIMLFDWVILRLRESWEGQRGGINRSVTAD